MKIIKAFPPNCAAINRAFHIRGKPVFFAYGDKIYNPAGAYIAPAIVVHERVHGERQGADPAAWWQRYIDDAVFRLDEEIPAHRAEYACYRSTAQTEQQLDLIAKRLSSPLYGNLVSYGLAVELLLQ